MLLFSITLGALPFTISAAEVHNHNGNSLRFNIEAMAAMFLIDENYSGTSGKRGWQESYIKTGLIRELQLDRGALYGGVGLTAQGTR